ncbi:MAG: hypothetical protein MUF83_00355 [Acidimicrobiales bacterium]|nr:hypothetical protein [Acidimicrobiales bacterium]
MGGELVGVGRDEHEEALGEDAVAVGLGGLQCLVDLCTPGRGEIRVQPPAAVVVDVGVHRVLPLPRHVGYVGVAVVSGVDPVASACAPPGPHLLGAAHDRLELRAGRLTFDGEELLLVGGGRDARQEHRRRFRELARCEGVVELRQPGEPLGETHQTMRLRGEEPALEAQPLGQRHARRRLVSGQRGQGLDELGLEGTDVGRQTPDSLRRGDGALRCCLLSVTVVRAGRLRRVRCTWRGALDVTEHMFVS